MLQLLWNLFKETGQINTYMLYKAVESSDYDDIPEYTPDQSDEGCDSNQPPHYTLTHRITHFARKVTE